MAKNLILTCSLCANFDSLRRKCKLTGDPREAHDASYAENCKIKGAFVRYIHVIPDVYNYFSVHEDTPPNWSPDLSKIPSDKNGLPLVVKTKRGLERAIPADPTVELRVDPVIGGKVPPILTYQGQREIIYEYGVTIAQQMAASAGVNLTVLPEEEGWKGLPDKVDAYLRATQKYDRGGKAWLTEKPIKWST